MNLKKCVLIISLLLILSVSIGMVSASSDITVTDVVSENVSTVSVDQVDDCDEYVSVSGDSEQKTFADIQKND